MIKKNDDYRTTFKHRIHEVHINKMKNVST